jgi:hypothetical protein
MAEMRYVLCRLDWRMHRHGDHKDCWTRSPGQKDLESFDTFEAAEVVRARNEAIARKRVNPFKCGAGFAELTHFMEAPFRDWLMDHEIPPPTGEKLQDWRTWWDANHKSWSAPQLQTIWQALNKLQFYIVEERPKRNLVYALMEIQWEYNDDTYDATSVPTGIKVYRTRKRAEIALREATDQMRTSGRWTLAHFEMKSLETQEEDPFLEDWKPRKSDGLQASVETAPFFEIVEIELEDDKI